MPMPARAALTRAGVWHKRCASAVARAPVALGCVGRRAMSSGAKTYEVVVFGGNGFVGSQVLATVNLRPAVSPQSSGQERSLHWCWRSLSFPAHPGADLQNVECTLCSLLRFASRWLEWGSRWRPSTALVHRARRRTGWKVLTTLPPMFLSLRYQPIMLRPVFTANYKGNTIAT